MKTISTLSLLAVAALLANTPAADSSNFELHEGDRVVFYGDSITDQRLYTTFAETYVVTRFPSMNVTFVHSGWGGDRVTGGGGGPIDIRLKRDVIAYQPTVMTIMLGMNDGSYRAFDQNIFNTYSTGYEKIVQTVRAAQPNVRFTLIQPSPFDDVTRPPSFEGGYNKVLVRYGDFLKELAQREKTGLADLNTSVVAALEKANQANPETAKKIIADRVHPGPGGQLLMAEALLRAWHAPALVASVEIDAEAGKVTQAENTKVASLKQGESLQWQQTDLALPMPVDMKDPVIALSVNSSDFVKNLNQEKLVVNKLPKEKYTLTIDGAKVGSFTSAQLASGVNLAELATPMAQQAMDVHKLTLQHNDMHFVRWRQVQLKVTGQPEHLSEALKGLDALEGDIIRQQRQAAQPKTRSFELRPD